MAALTTSSIQHIINRFNNPALLDPSKQENLEALRQLATQIPTLTTSQLPPLNVEALSDWNWIKAASDIVMGLSSLCCVLDAGHFSYQTRGYNPSQLYMLGLRVSATVLVFAISAFSSGRAKLEIKTEKARLAQDHRIALAFEPFKRLVTLASEMPEKPKNAYTDPDDVPIAQLKVYQKYQTWCNEWTLAKEAFLRALPEASPQEGHTSIAMPVDTK